VVRLEGDIEGEGDGFIVGDLGSLCAVAGRSELFLNNIKNF